MSYQTFHPDAGTTVVPIGRHSESNQTSSDIESRLYPFGKPVFLSSLSVQMVFVRKVWAIFTSELLVVTVTVALCFYIGYYNKNDGLPNFWWALLVVSLLLLFALTYKSNDDFQPPWYSVILYTCLNTYIIGTFVAVFQLAFILDTLILMLMASFSVLAFTYQTTYKFRAKEPLILVLVAIIVISSLLHPWVFSLSDLIPAFILALLFSLFFILDTWYLMKQMNKDEYWGANMQLYLDLIIPFRTIHHMCELTAEYGEDD